MASLGGALTNVPFRAASMLVVGVLLAVLLPATPGHAREGEQPASVSASLRYQITFVARSCDSYADVMANRVRDDRMEAATAPGRGNAYKDGQAVDPAVEAANGSGCTALNGWHFSLGPGQEKKGALSTVTTPGRRLRRDRGAGAAARRDRAQDRQGHRRRGDRHAVAGAGQARPRTASSGCRAARPATRCSPPRGPATASAPCAARADGHAGGQRAVARLPGRACGTCSASRTT